MSLTMLHSKFATYWAAQYLELHAHGLERLLQHEWWRLRLRLWLFNGDLDPRPLATEPSVLQRKPYCTIRSVSAIVSDLATLEKGQELCSEVHTLLQLYYALPASSAERSFSRIICEQRWQRSVSTACWHFIVHTDMCVIQSTLTM